MKSAYFAGGCFWCITPVFAEYDGVKNVVSGYSGGDEVNPTYEQVKHQETNHRETIRIDYDETAVNYGTLLDIYLANVDPFDEGGQFIDRGRSYTLAVYYETEEEKKKAAEMIGKLEKAAGKKAFISVERFRSFYDAEEYHQDYYKKNPEAFEEELRNSGRKK